MCLKGSLIASGSCQTNGCGFGFEVALNVDECVLYDMIQLRIDRTIDLCEWFVKWYGMKKHEGRE